MYIRFRKTLVLSIISSLLFICLNKANAQADISSFKANQLSAPRVAKAYATYNDILKKSFEEKGLVYPPNDIYIRTFKAQNEMEIWVKNPGADTFSFFKLYKICALSGSLGPKRWEGDRQVPEGYYFISNFNPSSDFYLSLLVSYPNYSDQLLGNKTNLGGDIYIHGGCVTIGCMPMQDAGIQEIYTLCLAAKFNGQNNIPVHIFPTRFNKAGLNFLGREYADNIDRQRFWINLKAGYDHFERTHTLYPVMYNQEGKYIY